uniref:hypothetical protein n=1 Tax=Candidatus Entotheonella palauensis TaxID=93172 RepID=UPI001C4E04EF
MSIDYSNLMYSGANSHIYYQPVSDYQCPIVIKILTSETPSLDRLHQFYNEFELTVVYDGAMEIRSLMVYPVP